MQVVELVVLRHAQPMARLHFHRSFAPASSSVSCPAPRPAAPPPAPGCSCRWRWSPPLAACWSPAPPCSSVVRMSWSGCRKSRRSSRTDPARAPGPGCFASTVQANVSPVEGFTASVPRKMGQAIEPVCPDCLGRDECSGRCRAAPPSASRSRRPSTGSSRESAPPPQTASAPGSTPPK